MANRFGFVNAEGELQGIVSPGSNNQYNHLEVMGDRICVVIPEADDHNDIMSTGWYNLSTNAWLTREAQPASYYKWSSGAWVLDSARLFEEIRAHRNVGLTNSDWTQLSDSPLTDAKKAEWATYRQTLRDFPATNSDATDFDALVWPTPPS